MVDLLIIGAGGAGLSAALHAHKENATVMVVGKASPTTAQTSMAQGGINAALGNITPDSIQAHIEDTLKSSHGLCNPQMVEQLCSQAPETIAWLDQLGVPFDRTQAGKVAQRQLGGASSKRACYAQDYTGLKILHTLYDNLLKAEIPVEENLFLLNLIVADQQVLGATFWDTTQGKVRAIYAHTTLIATGGYGALYKNFTTNSEGATGDGIAAVLRAGGWISDMEFVQFHPTALKSSATLISESARGEGGYLINRKGERFVDELLPRDVVARAIFEQINQGEAVFLDLRHLGKEKLLELMPQEIHLARLHEGVDPITELIPIKPVAHYTMGGIDVNEHLQVTGLSHCYAVGECSNAKIHGANRLGGNSLLEIIALGAKAAQHAISMAKNSSNPNTPHPQEHKDQAYIDSLFEEYPWEKNFYEIQAQLGSDFYRYAGIVRDNQELNNFLNELRVIRADLDNMGIGDKSRTQNSNLIDFLQFQNLLEIGEVVLDAALVRDESRGAHHKPAFPKEDDALFRAHACYWLENNVLQSKLIKVVSPCN